MNRTLPLLLSLLLALTLLGTPAAAQTSPDSSKERTLEPAAPDDVRTVPRAGTTNFVKQAENDPGTGLYLVRLEEPPAATYDGGVAGIPPTRPQAAGEQLEPESPSVQAYVAHLEQQQRRVIRDIVRRLGKARLHVPYTYQYGNNGFAAELTPEEAARVAQMPGVVFVQADELRELHMDRGAAWVGAPSIWDGTGVGGGLSSRGEGMVIGVIDTGINPTNPSFAAVAPGDGYVHENPRDKYYGACDPESDQYDEDFPCNDKLIGAWGFWGTGPDTPYDWDGHGSHTASTAAGNPVNATIVGAEEDPLVIERDIVGVAPRANIISYQACCSTGGLTAAIDQAIADGVDAINYSIGSPGASQLWDDFDTVGYLNARAAGIFVATSAGNDGPGDATVGSPSDAPWLVSVGASTHDRHVENYLEDLAGGATTPPGNLLGKGFSNGYGPAPIVYAGDYGHPLCATGTLDNPTNPFPAGTFDGEIVLCERGIFGRVDKGRMVRDAGAGGMILMNDAPSGDSLNGDAHVLPAVHITHADGLAVRDWLEDGDGHVGTIAGTVLAIDADRADTMVAFSSRGPNRSNDTITPHVTAPGVDILAAYGAHAGEGTVEWTFVSGTSMASPHVAGAGALLADVRPDWTMAEIQSALMTTARPEVTDSDGVSPATPFGMGNGHIDLTRAARAGIVLDVDIDDYWDANPADGGDPKTLNLPSMANSQCFLECTWTRTVKSAVDGPVEWTVTTSDPAVEVVPSSFTLGAQGETQELTITFDGGAYEAGEYVFEQVTLTADDATIPVALMPVAAVPTTGILPATVDIDTRRNAGSHEVIDLVGLEITDFHAPVMGLVAADLHEGELFQDPTRGDPYDDLDDVFFTTVEVPEGAVRLVAELGDTPMPDADLYVGTGTTPSEATELCVDGNPTSVELCTIESPAAGTYWVLVQNWEGTGNQPDSFELFVAVVPGSDLGNAHVEGPATNPVETPFDIRVFWDTPDMVEGERWYGQIEVSSSPSEPGDIGSIPVRIVRHADDVTKIADVATAERGDTVTYEITVQPNVTPEDLEYTITDTIPDGLTYVEGSVTGGATVNDGVVSWTGTMPALERRYEATTFATDPSCRVPLSEGPSAYLDLAAFGLLPDPSIEGDDFMLTAFTSGAPFEYWGTTRQGMRLLPTGFAMFGTDPGDFWAPQDIPDPAAPNGVLAPLWGDFEVVYSDDADDPRGITLANLGGTGPGSGVVIDFKGVEPWPAGSTDDRYTFQIFMWRSVSDGPGDWEIAFAYDHLDDLSGPLTVGLEDLLGTDALSIVGAGDASGSVSQGGAICFDFKAVGADPEVITYQVTVDQDAENDTYINEAVHDTDNPGSLPATASAEVLVTGEPQVEPELTGVTVTPATAAVAVGATRQFTATASFDDGSTQVVSNQATWSSSDTDVATVSGSGLAAAVAEGSVTITATFNDESGTASLTVTADEEPEPEPEPEPELPEGAFRLFGSGRLQTAVEISKATFEDGAAGAVVLARANTYPDALAGTPLAVDRDAPMLLTPTEALHEVTREEIQRVLPAGGTVYLLGGEAAIHAAVAEELTALGFETVRLFGASRIETARAIADELGNPDTLLITTGYDFPDALAAGAAAADAGGAVLLTTAETPHAALTAYLDAHPDATVFAVGGPAARAYPGATGVFGSTREGTAVRVAETFFDDPIPVGFARRDDFPDALAGGAHIGRLGGPLLLTPTGMLHPTPEAYVCANAASLTTAFAYGGTSALSASTVDAIAARIDGEGC